jgi:hypothetical protein
MSPEGLVGSASMPHVDCTVLLFLAIATTIRHPILEPRHSYDM